MANIRYICVCVCVLIECPIHFKSWHQKNQYKPRLSWSNWGRHPNFWYKISIINSTQCSHTLFRLSPINDQKVENHKFCHILEAPKLFMPTLSVIISQQCLTRSNFRVKFCIKQINKNVPPCIIPKPDFHFKNKPFRIGIEMQFLCLLCGIKALELICRV